MDLNLLSKDLRVPGAGHNDHNVVKTIVTKKKKTKKKLGFHLTLLLFRFVNLRSCFVIGISDNMRVLK